MDKKWDKWLIIIGLILIFQFLIFYTSLASLWIVVIGVILVAFGIINYTKLNIWVKIILTPVLAFILFFVAFWIMLAIEQVIFGREVVLP